MVEVKVNIVNPVVAGVELTLCKQAHAHRGAQGGGSQAWLAWPGGSAESRATETHAEEAHLYKQAEDVRERAWALP